MLPELGSGSLAVTVAVLVMEVAVDVPTNTVIGMGTLAPGGIVPRVQVMIVPDPVQKPGAAVSVVPAGSVSVTVTPVAGSSRLLLVTVSMYGNGLPTATGSPRSIFVMLRSASIGLPARTLNT